MNSQGVKQRVRILRILNSRDFVSGERIAHICKISRIAVWKHISYLINNGVKIRVYPNKGYEFLSFGKRLLPEVVKLHLGKSEFVKDIFYFDEIDSTNEYAKKILRERSLIIAEQQKKGKGRLDRNWYSQKYKDLLFSFILTPDVPYIYAGIFNALAVISVVKSLNKLYKLDAQSKWPNDVVISGRKISGVLIEFSAQTDLINKLIIGIGIDVNSTPKVSNAISVKKLIRNDADRVKLLVRIMKELEHYFDLINLKNFKKIKRDWMKYSADYLQRVRIIQGGERLEGISGGINEYGNLVLKQRAKHLIIPPISNARLKIKY